MPSPSPIIEPPTDPEPSPRLREIARCWLCGGDLAGLEVCPTCGRPHPELDGILRAMGPLTGRNRVAGAFYDGPGWARFRPWERWFLRVQGGEARARRQVLRHLNAPTTARVLEVGIGDGANLRLLPDGWTAFGVDIALQPLRDCLDRDPRMAGRLALAEAEALPFADGTFDSCWTLGGFNYFRDREAALREMARVTRPGGTLVVADEIPGLHRYGIGHLIGFPAIDASWLRALGLDREFVAMVLSTDFDPDLVVPAIWPGAARFSIWCGLGYGFAFTVPTPDLTLRRNPA